MSPWRTRPTRKGPLTPRPSQAIVLRPLGDRLTARPTALDRIIGVRIPVSQPSFRASIDRPKGRFRRSWGALIASCE